MLPNSSRHLLQSIILCIICLTSFPVFSADTIPQKDYRIQGVSGPLKRMIEKRLKAVPFHTGMPSQMRTAECKQAIQQILEAYGYFRAEIQSTVKSTPLGDHIVYTITKGPQLLITQLLITLLGEGTSNPNLNKVIKTFSAQKNSPMTTANYQKIKEELYQATVSEGYLDAIWKTHRVAIDLQSYTAVVTLSLDTKPRYTIGTIQLFKESRFLNSTFLKGYLGIQEGSPYRLKQILKAQTALRHSDYFKEAVIETPATHGIYKVPLQVTLTPAPKYYTLCSLGFRSDLGLRAKAEGLIRYLNPKGHQLSGMLETSAREFHGLGLYKIPGSLPATQQHHIQFEYKGDYLFSEAHTQSNPISAYFPISLPFQNPATFCRYLFIQHYPKFTLLPFITLHYEHSQVSEHFPTTPYIGLIPGIRLKKKEAKWAQNPHNYRFSFQLEGTPFASSSFVKLEAKGTYFGYLSPFIPSSYLILRGRIGSLFTKKLTNLPKSLRFYAGGYNYPRGHKKYALGAHTAGGGIEARLHLTGLFYLNPFFELNYDTNNEKIQKKGSTGVGLCLWYPHIGTIEVAWVYRINPDSSQRHWGPIAKISTSLE